MPLLLLEEGEEDETKSFVELLSTSSSRDGEDATVVRRIRRVRPGRSSGEDDGASTSSFTIIFVAVVENDRGGGSRGRRAVASSIRPPRRWRGANAADDDPSDVAVATPAAARWIKNLIGQPLRICRPPPQLRDV
jgi:hypothetical protein